MGSHFGVGATPIVVYFSWGFGCSLAYGILTHGHLGVSLVDPQHNVVFLLEAFFGLPKLQNMLLAGVGLLIHFRLGGAAWGATLCLEAPKTEAFGLWPEGHYKHASDSGGQQESSKYPARFHFPEGNKGNQLKIQQHG